MQGNLHWIMDGPHCFHKGPSAGKLEKQFHLRAQRAFQSNRPFCLLGVFVLMLVTDLGMKDLGVLYRTVDSS